MATIVSSPQDISMTDTQSPPAIPKPSEPSYGGFTRFEIELEVHIPSWYSPWKTLTLTHIQFVQSLAHPQYLGHLASQKYLEDPAFIAYLAYLQYWSQPPYSKFLSYPGPTLKHLELLQQERFRKEILSPALAMQLMEEEIKAAVPVNEGSWGLGWRRMGIA